MKFETGRTYGSRLATNHDMSADITVLSRTEKTIKAKTDFGVKTLRIQEWRGVEQVKPWGSYSMCPVIGADDIRTS